MAEIEKEVVPASEISDSKLEEPQNGFQHETQLRSLRNMSRRRKSRWKKGKCSSCFSRQMSLLDRWNLSEGN
jgi:hypothetical protein